MAVSGSSGGSGGADAIRAGKAFVELASKDDSLRAGLDAAKKRVEDFQKQLAHPMLRPAMKEFASLGLQADSLNKRLDLEQARAKLASPMLRPALKEFAQLSLQIDSVNKKVGLEQARAKLANPMLRPLLQDIAKTEKAMEKLNKQFEFEQLRAKVGPIRAHLQSIGDKAKSIGQGMAIGGAGILGAGTAVVAPLAAAFKGAIDRGSEVSRLGTKLGVSTEQLSEFAYACETTGMSFEDMTGQFENLAERVAQGAAGGGEAAETFKKLGINAAELKLKNPVDQMIAIAEAMEGVTNETERLGMLSSLGGDQFQWMNNIFKQGPEGIRKLMQEAKDVGASVSSESAANAVKVEQAFNRAWASVKGAFLSLAEAFLPLAPYVESAVRLFVSVTKGVREFIQNNTTLVAIIGAVGTAIAGLGGAILVVGGIIAAFGAALPAIGAVAAVVFAPITLKILAIAAAVAVVVAAIGGLTYAFFKFTELGRILGSTFGTMFSEMWGTAKATLGGIADALKAGNLKLAWDIACKGMRIVWNDLVIGLKTAWNDFLKWHFTRTMDAVQSVAKAFGLDDLLARVTGSEEEGRKKFVDMLGFDLTADIAHRDKLKKELQGLIDQAKPTTADVPTGKLQMPDLTKYLGKMTDSVKGLFAAPNLNQALGYGDNTKKIEKATVDTAKNTKVIADEIKRMEPATFR